MKLSNTNLIIAAAAVALAVTGGIVNSRPAVAQNVSPGAPVTIMSPLPVPVRDVDNSAMGAFQVRLCAPIGSPGCVVNAAGDVVPPSYTVPSNRRAVIEYVSGPCQFFSPFPPDGYFDIETSVAGVEARHEVELSQKSENTWSAAQLTRIYADPGSTVRLIVRGSDSDACHVTISGYTATR